MLHRGDCFRISDHKLTISPISFLLGGNQPSVFGIRHADTYRSIPRVRVETTLLIVI